jgi:glycosyltransferase involved in cell wall biosynthesis
MANVKQVWAVGLVLNEADIIEYTLKNFEAQGVNGIIVQDNGSTDDTIKKLEHFQNTTGIKATLILEGKNTGYFQSRNMTALAHFAASLGAEYIIPFDADELWYAPGHERLADLIREADAGCIHAEQYFYYSTREDIQHEMNPYKRIVWRTKEVRPWKKVCFKWFPGAHIGGGNHSLQDADGNEVSRGRYIDIKIGHFPCRSFEQMLDKVVRHGRSMDLQHPDDPTWGGDGPAHNYLYRKFVNEGAAALKQIWEWGDKQTDYSGFCLSRNYKSLGLVNSPAPYKEVTR